jgi:hypothetical protein
MSKRIILALLCVLILPSIFATDTEGINLSATLINQIPDPVRAGEIVEFRFSIQNYGSASVNDAIISLETSYPFEEIPGENYNITINKISAYQNSEYAITTKYKLLVNKDAPNGEYEIKLKINTNNNITNIYTFDVFVTGKEYAQIITINKSNIDFGKVEQLDFLISNTGNSQLKNLVFSWTDPTETLLPVNSDNTKYIKYLDVGASTTVSYKVMANSNADPGLYKIDLSLEFENEDYNDTKINTIAGIFVGGQTNFDITFSESNSGNISLSIANVGNNPAYAINVIIPEQENYKVSGTNSSILGNLDKGDYTIASFNISPKRSFDTNSMPTNQIPRRTDKNDNLPYANPTHQNNLEVTIEYTDSMGQRNSITKKVNISSNTNVAPSEITNNTNSGYVAQFNRRSPRTNWYVYIIIGLVSLVALFYAHKFYTKNSKKKKQ